jgi:hypothetical protein
MKFSSTSLAAAALVISACGTGKSFVGNHFEDRHVDYRVGSPGSGWRQLQLETSNISWFNDATGAALLVNSHCEGVQDSPLEGLTGELLIGTTEREVLEQTVRPWSGREAMETIATGKLDGVARKNALFVVKKDGCVYDIVYDAPVANFDAGYASYVAVRDGFSIAGRRDR